MLFWARKNLWNMAAAESRSVTAATKPSPSAGFSPPFTSDSAASQLGEVFDQPLLAPPPLLHSPLRSLRYAMRAGTESLTYPTDSSNSNGLITLPSMV